MGEGEGERAPMLQTPSRLPRSLASGRASGHSLQVTDLVKFLLRGSLFLWRQKPGLARVPRWCEQQCARFCGRNRVNLILVSGPRAAAAPEAHEDGLLRRALCFHCSPWASLRPLLPRRRCNVAVAGHY